MKKRLISVTVALLVVVTCSAQVFAAPALKPNDKENQSSTSSSTAKGKTTKNIPPADPDAYIAQHR